VGKMTNFLPSPPNSPFAHLPSLDPASEEKRKGGEREEKRGEATSFLRLCPVVYPERQDGKSRKKREKKGLREEKRRKNVSSLFCLEKSLLARTREKKGGKWKGGEEGGLGERTTNTILFLLPPPLNPSAPAQRG